MIEDIRTDVVKILLNIRKKEGQVQRTQTTQITGAGLEDTAINLVDGNISEKEGGMNKTVVNEEPKIGRNRFHALVVRERSIKIVVESSIK